MTYGLPTEDTTGPLFDYYYEVRVPYLSTISVDYARAIGTYTTTDKNIDNAINSQWIQTMMPISLMIDKYSEGTQVRIVKESDIVPIYTAINNHLKSWRTMLERGINIGGAPVEDLYQMDRFAADLYEYAKHTAQPETLASMAAQALNEFMPFNASNFFKGKDMRKKTTTEGDIIRINGFDEKGEPPERENLQTFLKQQMILLRR